MTPHVNDLVEFDDRSLKSKWAGKKVPMAAVYEAYIEGKIDITPDKWEELFDTRTQTMTFNLHESHIKWAITNYLPKVAIHSKKQDKEVVGEHYNRGNDFFGWFLGEAMVYTAASYETPEMSLEEAQYRKIDRVCEKLQLKENESLLDIGCGWGTFTARSAREFKSNSYGVCLAQEQVDFGTQRIKDYDVVDRARVEVCDYRNIQGQFDKIVSLEMVEHVGIKNLAVYYEKVHSLLKDEGLFLMSWTGIRDLYNPQNPLTAFSLRGEDLIWGLFMNRYIFEGADASLTLSSMVRGAEEAGFEVADVENMSAHYVITLRQWRDLWVQNKEEVLKVYGERWYRLWKFFLHWSALIGEQGSAFNYQILFHKNHDSYNRRKLFFDCKSWR
ncbi:MAG: cyclopropane-fatty-acyl-phospholipid synthase family protein [Polyangiaceae bacterium]|nr:cyclopropane-fatty-acyl-phospholipid synthase family protein [Polyangiaceae bacterium]